MRSSALFDRASKVRNRLIAAAGMLLAAAAPFMAGLMALGLLINPHEGVAAAGITIACFGLAAGLPWQAQNLLTLAGNSALRRKLLKKLAAERPEELREGARFVGFAPGDLLRTWDGETDCDVGFLTVLPQALVYAGDHYTWSLRKGLVDRVELAPSTGGIRRIIVRWHAPREPSRAFTVECREGGTLRAANRATDALGRELLLWQEAGVTDESNVPLLGFPPTDAPGALRMDAVAPGSCIATLALAVITVLTIWRIAGDFIKHEQYYYGILWSGLITVLAAGLAFHVLAYLQSWAATLPPKAPPPPPRDPMM